MIAARSGASNILAKAICFCLATLTLSIGLNDTLPQPTRELLPACYATEGVAAQSLKIGGIYYFAFDGIGLEKIKKIMPVKVGDSVSFSPGDMRNLKKKLVDAVHESTDDEPSDIAIVVSDKICFCYVGLRGKNLDESTISIGSVGARSQLRVPEKIQSKYLELMQAEFSASARNSGTEKLKANLFREEIEKEAIKSADELLAVSLSSSDAFHRKIANYCLGLIANNKDQLDALAKATHDSDSAVRADAIKALTAISRNEKLQALVPAVQMIPLLNSPTWSERNKGVELVSLYTKSRQPQFLEELRKQALASLKEMAAWDSDHARAALLILGRTAGIPEDRLSELINKDDRVAILSAVGSKSGSMDKASQLKSSESAQKVVSKLATKTKAPALTNGFYLVLREFPDNKKINATGKNELILVNDYRFLSPEERDTAEYLVIDRSQFVPFELKAQPSKQTDERGRPKLLLTLNQSQVKPLENFTTKYKGRHVVIVVGGEVVTKHKIREAIKGGLIQITRCSDNGCEAIYTELARKK